MAAKPVGLVFLATFFFFLTFFFFTTVLAEVGFGTGFFFAPCLLEAVFLATGFLRGDLFSCCPAFFFSLDCV